MTNSTFYKATFMGENHFSKQKTIGTTAFQTNTKRGLKIEIPIIKFNISATYNTVGIINKLVMVFAICSCSHDKSVLTCNATAPVYKRKLYKPRLKSCFQTNLYRDTPAAKSNYYPDCKNARHTLLAP